MKDAPASVESANRVTTRVVKFPWKRGRHACGVPGVASGIPTGYRGTHFQRASHWSSWAPRRCFTIPGEVLPNLDSTQAQDPRLSRVPVGPSPTTLSGTFRAAWIGTAFKADRLHHTDVSRNRPGRSSSAKPHSWRRRPVRGKQRFGIRIRTSPHWGSVWTAASPGRRRVL